MNWLFVFGLVMSNFALALDYTNPTEPLAPVVEVDCPRFDGVWKEKDAEGLITITQPHCGQIRIDRFGQAFFFNTDDERKLKFGDIEVVINQQAYWGHESEWAFLMQEAETRFPESGGEEYPAKIEQSTEIGLWLSASDQLTLRLRLHRLIVLKNGEVERALVDQDYYYVKR